jgi:hypothetical protein
VPFDRNGSDLDICAPVVAISPVSSVSVPIPVALLVPISVIPIAVTAILVSSGRKYASDDYPESEDR